MKRLMFSLLVARLVCGCAPKSQPTAIEVARAEASQILLKDFAPVSIFNIPETFVQKGKFEVIDFHSHDYINCDLEQLAERVAIMDKCGVSHVHVLHCEWIGMPFEDAIKAYSNYPGRFSVWCSIDYSDFEADDWTERAIAHLDRCKAMGAVGIGEMVDKGHGDTYARPVPGKGIHLDHPKMQAVLEHAGRIGMPISIHMAEPIWMYEEISPKNDGLMNGAYWKIDVTEEGCYDFDEIMECFVNAAKAHPQTTFVACHYLNMTHDYERLGAILDECPNVYVDLSGRLGESAVIPRATARFFNKYSDRILYGTDNGISEDMYTFSFRILETDDEHIYHHSFGYHWSYSGLDLSDDVLRKVYNENAKRIMKLNER